MATGTQTEVQARGDVDIAAAAAMMADPSRAAVLMELTDGRAVPPSELAEVAAVSRSTMSEHLAKLQKGGFLAVERAAGTAITGSPGRRSRPRPRRSRRWRRAPGSAACARPTGRAPSAPRAPVTDTSRGGSESASPTRSSTAAWSSAKGRCSAHRAGHGVPRRPRDRATAARRQVLQRLVRAPPAPRRQARRGADEAPLRAGVGEADGAAARGRGDRRGQAEAGRAPLDLRCLSRSRGPGGAPPASPRRRSAPCSPRSVRTWPGTAR